MSDIRSESIVRTYTVRGRTINVTEILWAQGGASYDAATDDGFALHNESFDTIPTLAEVENLIDNLAGGWDADGMHSTEEIDVFLATLAPESAAPGALTDEEILNFDRQILDEGR
jgi:hypothetical protein